MLFCLFFIILPSCSKREKAFFEVEEGKFLSPKFDKDGLIPVTTSDSGSGELLMHGYMNEEALKKTLKLKRLIIGVDQDNQFGIKEKQVGLFKSKRDSN